MPAGTPGLPSRTVHAHESGVSYRDGRMRGEGQRVVTPLVNGITCSAVEAAHSCLREWGAAVRAGTRPAPRHDALADDGVLRRPRLPGDLGEWQAFRGS